MGKITNRRHPGLLILVMVVSALACALPGISTSSNNPVSDPNSLSTIIAGTASAAAEQTAQARFLTGTPPPSLIEKVVPSATATSTPQISTEGTSLVKQSDGSYLFADYQGGYSVVVSSGWLAVRANEPEFMAAGNLPLASDPKIQHFLTQVQNSDPKVLRLAGADILPADMLGNYLTNFSITWDRNNPLTLQQEIDQAKKSLPQQIKGARISYADTGFTSTRIPMGIVELNWSTKNTSGQTTLFHEKIVVFKVKSGTLAFTLTTTTDLNVSLLIGFDFMTDQIKMFP